MLIDDRLATVLRQNDGGEATARIQFRQLLDILGTLPSEARGPQVDAAHDRLAALSARIPMMGRAAILGEPGLRLRNPRLVANLCAEEPDVAHAALSAAQLDEEQWLDLAPALPIAVRGAMRRRRNLGPRVEALLDRLGIHDRGLPPAEVSEVEIRPAVLPVRDRTPVAQDAENGIGAIVRRIEDFRRARQPMAGVSHSTDSPLLPLDEVTGQLSGPGILSFDFGTDTEGRIVWGDAPVAPMVVGMRLAGPDALTGGHGAAPGQAIRNRQPVRGAKVELEGAPAIAGSWQVDAAPQFDSAGGRFTGYTGRMRRLLKCDGGEQALSNDSEADRVRQLLHELRTPVNAIQGFAEVIQQQLFGPTPHEYRALAASIASDAAHMLAGFDELERMAKLEARAIELEEGTCDLAQVLSRTEAQLRHFTKGRDSGFVLDIPEDPLPVALAEADAEKLAWRLLATLAGAAHPGEITRLAASSAGTAVELAMQLPVSLASRDETELMQATTAQSAQALSAGMFGQGFTLRLARAEARAAGGALERRGQELVLRLPGLTREAAANSQ
ncbi:MAG: histidine kinase dimerization/phospho-acceptor domain-containing protein [Novosphingobium sp.]